MYTHKKGDARAKLMYCLPIAFAVLVAVFLISA